MPSHFRMGHTSSFLPKVQVIGMIPERREGLRYFGFLQPSLPIQSSELELLSTWSHYTVLTEDLVSTGAISRSCS